MIVGRDARLRPTYGGIRLQSATPAGGRLFFFASLGAQSWRLSQQRRRQH